VRAAPSQPTNQQQNAPRPPVYLEPHAAGGCSQTPTRTCPVLLQGARSKNMHRGVRGRMGRGRQWAGAMGGTAQRNKPTAFLFTQMAALTAVEQRALQCGVRLLDAREAAGRVACTPWLHLALQNQRRLDGAGRGVSRRDDGVGDRVCTCRLQQDCTGSPKPKPNARSHPCTRPGARTCTRDRGAWYMCVRNIDMVVGNRQGAGWLRGHRQRRGAHASLLRRARASR
jgi:hypothetical protein